MNIDIDSACIYGPQAQTRPLTATWTLTSSRPQVVAQVSHIRLFFTSITSPVRHSAQTTPLLFLSHFSAMYLFASYSVRAGHGLVSQLLDFFFIQYILILVSPPLTLPVSSTLLPSLSKPFLFLLRKQTGIIIK